MEFEKFNKFNKIEESKSSKSIKDKLLKARDIISSQMFIDNDINGDLSSLMDGIDKLIKKI